MVMIGITLVDLAYGREGVVTLLTLVSVHALILLTTATVLLELAVAREHVPLSGDTSSAVRPWTHIVGRCVQSTLLHPIPLPIVCGLLFAQTGWHLPTPIDKPLQLLGQAFGPVSLVLVGVTLAHTPVGRHWRVALGVSLSKNLALPVLVGFSAWFWGLRDLPLTVVVVAAALPVGANVFLFSQRYGVAHEEVTASMGLSTALALLTLSTVMWLM
jgi:malonate transporter and related proteins